MSIASAPRAALAACALVLTAAFTAATASAQIAVGSRLGFTGVADAKDVGTPGVELDFVPTVDVDADGNTGAFAALNRRNGNGLTGSIADLVVGNGPQRVQNFLVIGGYRFDLLSLPSGPYGQADCYVDPMPGQTCTPFQSVLGDPETNAGLSPFFLANTVSGYPEAPITALVSFNLFGTVTGPGGAMSEFFGTISSTFEGLSFQEVLGGLEGAGMYDQALPGVTFSGSFVTGRQIRGDEVVDVAVTPEPASFALVGAGLAGVATLAGVARRRRG